MKDNMDNLMKQTQQMQENLKHAQTELTTMKVEDQTSSDMVKITMTCRNEVKRISINDNLMSDDKEMLEGMICASKFCTSACTNISSRIVVSAVDWISVFSWLICAVGVLPVLSISKCSLMVLPKCCVSALCSFF